MADTSVDQICSADENSIKETILDVVFSDIFDDFQKVKIISHFTRNNLFRDEIRKKFADKPEFIIMVLRKLHHDVDAISNFIMDHNEISYGIVRRYVESIVGPTCSVGGTGEQCNSHSKIPKKEMLERFFKLDKDDIIREFPIILRQENKYTEDELNEILTFLIKNGICLDGYFYLLANDERKSIAISFFSKNKRYDLVRAVLNVS